MTEKFTIRLLLTLLLICALTQSYAQTWGTSPATTFIGPYPNRYGTAGFKINDKVYMGLGQSGDTRIHKDLYEYNPATGQWIYKTDFPGGNRVSPAVFVVGNKVYVGLGGANRDFGSGKSDLWEYNPASNTWTRKADFPGTRFGAATFVIDGKCYIVAGYGEPANDGNSNTGARRDCWQYDPQTNIWTKKANLPSVDPQFEVNGNLTRRWLAIGFTFNGKGYVGGGYDRYSTEEAKTDFWQYNPVTNSWTNMGIFPSSTAGLGLIGSQSFEFCGKIYIGLGGTTQNGFAIVPNYSFFIYDPATNSFSSMPAFPSGNSFFTQGVMFHYNGKIYAGSPALYTYNMHSISGPASTCSTASFSLSNVPSGTPVSWQASPSSYFTASTGVGSTASLTSASSTVGGQAAITFFVGGCAEPISKTFWIGLPSNSISAVYNSSHGWVTFDPASPSPGTTYSWVIDGIPYPYGNAIHPMPACGGSPYVTSYVFEATLTASSACGTTTMCRSYKFTCVPSKTFTSLGVCGYVPPPDCNPSLTAYEVSPNPAKGRIKIITPSLKIPPCEALTASEDANSRVATEAENNSKKDIVNQWVSIYDLQGQKKYSEFFANKKDFDIDVSNLSQGIYILHIKTGKHVEQHRIVIE